MLCEDAYDCAKRAEALVTEWDMFRALDFRPLGEVMAAKTIVDLRNVYSGEDVRRREFSYIGMECHSPDFSVRPDGACCQWRKVPPVPIRLRQTPTRCGVGPGSGIKLGIGRCLDVARDAEQRAEGVERVEAPVEAEREFVEVGL